MHRSELLLSWFGVWICCAVVFACKLGALTRSFKFSVECTGNVDKAITDSSVMGASYANYCSYYSVESNCKSLGIKLQCIR